VYLADKENAARSVDCLHFPFAFVVVVRIVVAVVVVVIAVVVVCNYWKRMWVKPLTE